MTKIIYPPLVEQSYSFAVEQGIQTTKDEIYRMMVKNDMIDEVGNPTKFALDNGLVSDFTEKDGMSLLDFKKMYPIFKSYPFKHFTYESKRWYIDGVILGDITTMKNLDNDLDNQLRAYFEQRNYENPTTVAENKAIYYPMYEPYNADEFVIKDGKMLVPESIVKDIAHRMLNGELDGSVEKAYKLLAQFEDE